MALAQTNEEVFREYQFNFNLPGSRANGMGGTFIGVADDATASFGNPAGLAFLNEMAIAIEYRHREHDTVTGEVSGFFNTNFEQLGVTIKDFNFFSLNLRWKSLYFGVYQYNYLKERQERQFISRSLTMGQESLSRRNVLLDLNGDSRGLGVASRFGPWKLGFSLNNIELKGNTYYLRESFEESPVIPNLPRSIRYESSISDQDTGWGFNLGVHHEWSDRFSWGAIWRKQPRLTLSESVTEEVDANPVFVDQVDVPFVIPDVIGAGAQYKVFPYLRLVLDWQRIRYSQIIKDGFIIVESIESETRENYHIDDVDEFHLGVEWLIPTEHNVWALRTGYYKNPLHAVTYSGDDLAVQSRFEGIGLKDEHRLSAGVGWVLQNSLELDMAASWWKGGREITVSLIWRKK